MRNKRVLVSLIIIGCLIGVYFLNNNTAYRSPSNVNINKEQVISAIRWKINAVDSEILIDLDCEDWSSMEVVLKSEGVAYSGEPSRMVQTSLCGEGYNGFYQIWPRNLMPDHEGIQKIGFNEEPPPAWTLEKIKFFGSLGTIEISAVEIYRLTGEIFIFEAY
jgi:hypothetical protein